MYWELFNLPYTPVNIYDVNVKTFMHCTHIFSVLQLEMKVNFSVISSFHPRYLVRFLLYISMGTGKYPHPRALSYDVHVHAFDTVSEKNRYLRSYSIQKICI